MRGDFSAWNKDRSQNFRGTLHQQGRVLLDRDWNAQTEITDEWQETAARDAFGPGVAAVPADAVNSFKVTSATVIGGEVKVSLDPGRVWADGLLVQSDVKVERTATYLGPPVQASPAPDAVPVDADRDAVIMETWLEELSPFQRPELLIEPALGGVDTTERVQTAYRIRLYRMADGDTCDSIIENLKDKFGDKGKLTVELTPSTTIDGDCPVVQGGGYTGFEHRLYRIEIADVDAAKGPDSYFKWSQFNGGLVGTGDFTSSPNKVTIHGNRNAIIYSGIKNFYLEALDFDVDLGCWTVVYGAKAKLAPDNTLTLPDPVTSPGDIYKGSVALAAAKPNRFFRLWNGIEKVKVSATSPLPDMAGINITFGAGSFSPSDFWTFEVRAGGLGNPLTLIDDLAPQGIFYHRVPLAEVTWTGDPAIGNPIEDCRRPFQPLTKLRCCCTYRVGDGIHSHGDFKTIQAAINALPKEDGGEICVLPGIYPEKITLDEDHNRNITIRGCGTRSIIRAETADPAIHIKYGQGITIESLAIDAHENGYGILLEGEGMTKDGKNSDKYLKDILLSDLNITAARRSALKGYVAQTLTLRNSTIRITDVSTRHPGVYLSGDDMLVERNEIRVLSPRAKDTADPETNDPHRYVAATFATGGLQIGGGSERVRIIDNLISGGIGNGITLGSIDLVKDGVIVTTHGPVRGEDPIDPCNPDDDHTDDDETTGDGSTLVAGAPLEDVLIKFNRIFNMGRNGIGVATFFAMGDKIDYDDKVLLRRFTVRGIISVIRLVILENRLEHCLNITPKPIPVKMVSLMGYAGISLANVSYLVIRDNFIIANGKRDIDAVCGIFVLHGEGIEISRNHILNNGLSRSIEVAPRTVVRGPRGGIWIARTEQLRRDPGSRLLDAADYRAARAAVAGPASGVAAADIRENVVSVPFGRSLTLIANGAVSVTDNDLTSFGIEPVSIGDLLVDFRRNNNQFSDSALLQIFALAAGNVLLFNLGVAADILAFAGFASISKGTATVGTATASQMRSAGSPLKNADFGAFIATTPSAGGTSTTAGATAPASAVQRTFFDNGSVLFTDNQCRLDLRTSSPALAISSIFIASLDDIGFHSNKSYCDLADDFIGLNTLLFGLTTRASDNRFRESGDRIFFSGATFGILNVTTDNESTLCLLVRGKLFLDRFNLVLLEFALGLTGDIARNYDDNDERTCNRMDRFLAGFGVKGGVQTPTPK